MTIQGMFRQILVVISSTSLLLAQQQTSPPPPAKKTAAAPPAVQATAPRAQTSGHPSAAPPPAGAAAKKPAPRQKASPAPSRAQAPTPPRTSVNVVMTPIQPAQPQASGAAGAGIRTRAYRPMIVKRVRSEAILFSRPPTPIPVSAQREFLGPAPGPGYVFVPGYYSWSGAKFIWVGQAWAVPPIAGAQWIEPQWQFDNGSNEWTMQEGYWQNPDSDAPAQVVQQNESKPQEIAAPLPVPASVAPPDSTPVVSVANGQVIVAPLFQTSYSMNVSSDGWHLVGDFSTASPDGVLIWINDGKQKGRKTTTFYRPAAQTTGSIDFAFPYPGSYYISFTNPSTDRIYLNLNLNLSQQ